MKRKILGLLAVGFLAGPMAANADVIIDVEESLGDLVFSGSGTIDLTGIEVVFTAGGSTCITPSGDPFGAVGLYQNVTGDTGSLLIPFLTNPGAFGSSGFYCNNVISTGDIFGVITQGNVRLDEQYISGSALSFTSTFIGVSFATLGITPGVYQWTTLNDTITMNIGGVSVPEPSTLALLGLGLVGMGMRRRVKAS